MTTNTFDAALQYQQKGFPVIPIRPDKKPFISWQEFQSRKATEAEIKNWWSKWPDAMIGIVTGKISKLFVLDCDTQEAIEKIESMLPDGFLCPIAQTPRDGRHYYFTYPEDANLTVGTQIMPGIDFRGEGGFIIVPPSINGNGKAYQWLSGLSIFEAPRPPVYNNILLYIIEHEKGTLRGQQKTTITTNDNKYFSLGTRDNDLFHAANCLIKGGSEIPFTKQVIEMLARNTTPPFPENEINARIESALTRAENRERHLTAEIREWIMTTNGNFMTTNIYKELGITTIDNMKKANIALARMCEGENPILERCGDKRGCYRRIERDYETSDWLNAATEEFDIALPFDLNSHVKIYPGNIIIIAGTANVGKTSVLLNLLKDNMEKYPCHYVSSEAGAVEMKSRIMLFDHPAPHNWKFEFIERASNFADLIRCHTDTKRIWIIDYLEMPENPWQIVQPIREIHSNLKDGVCVLALQKKSGTDVGRGGEGTLEKPRLYLSLDRDDESNIAKIVKAKAWRSSAFNPNGRTLRFKLVNGAHIKTSGAWA